MLDTLIPDTGGGSILICVYTLCYILHIYVYHVYQCIIRDRALFHIRNSRYTGDVSFRVARIAALQTNLSS
jgi:hypothetical protein